MDKKNKQLNKVIQESLTFPDLDKDKILRCAKEEVRQKVYAKPKKQGVRFGRVLRWASMGVASIIIMVVCIGLVSDLFFANNDNAQAPEASIYSYMQSYEYRIELATEDEMEEMGIEYLSLSTPADQYKLYYDKNDDSLAMVELTYYTTLESGSIAELFLTTAYSTDTFHEKYEDLLSSSFISYNDAILQALDGYVNGEYMLEACIMAEFTYFLSVESPEEFDNEKYFDLILEILGQ